jgi:hypothetical protein
MVEHRIDLICRKCDFRIENVKDNKNPRLSDYRYENGQKRFPYCPQCDALMKHDCYTTGDYRHTSDSLAFHPDDIPEHRRLYPDVEVTPQGQPKFTSPKQQEHYAEKSAGCYKKAQKTKSRLGRTRIA